MTSATSLLTTALHYVGRQAEGRATGIDGDRTGSSTDKTAVKSDNRWSIRDEVVLSPEALQHAQESMATQSTPLSRAHLKRENERILAQLNFDVATADAEVATMDRSDPARVQSAEQAMAFRHKTGKNPFAGLSRSDLTAIIYDESGKYTLHERWAAGAEQQRQDYEYWRPIAKRAVMTDDRRELYHAWADFHHSLTPLEQSRDEYVGFAETVTRLIKDEEREHGKLTDADAPTLAKFLHYLGRADKPAEKVEDADLTSNEDAALPSSPDARADWQRFDEMLRSAEPARWYDWLDAIRPPAS